MRTNNRLALWRHELSIRNTVRYLQKYRVTLLGVMVLVALFALFGPNVPMASAAAGESLLYSGQALYPGQSIVSPNKGYKLLMQGDGNLVLYEGSSSNWTWQSHTYAENASYAVIQTDGNFVIYNTTGHPLWSTGTNGNPGARLDIQDDGNLVVYNSAWQHLWAIDHHTNTMCWHTYHRNDITYGGWITIGHLHLSADVCNDGSNVWLQAGAYPLQCWTDNGFVGNAWVTFCQPTYSPGNLGVEAHMHMHKDVGIQAAIVSIPFGIDADAYVGNRVNAYNTSQTTTGNVSVLWLASKVQ